MNTTTAKDHGLVAPQVWLANKGVRYEKRPVKGEDGQPIAGLAEGHDRRQGRLAGGDGPRGHDGPGLRYGSEHGYASRSRRGNETSICPWPQRAGDKPGGAG